MPARVSPTERIRAEIDELFAADRDLGEVLEDVARVGARLLLQTALEAEVTEFGGRERYARGDRAREGSRNGYAPVTVKTTAGPVALQRPKLRGTDERFASRLLGRHVTKTNALESLTIAGYVRGLSTRDVEASLADALGAEATLSKSTVSRVCEAITVEFDQWRARDLSDVELEYLYMGSVNRGAVRAEVTSHRISPAVTGIEERSALVGPHPLCDKRRATRRLLATLRPASPSEEWCIAYCGCWWMPSRWGTGPGSTPEIRACRRIADKSEDASLRARTAVWEAAVALLGGRLDDAESRPRSAAMSDPPAQDARALEAHLDLLARERGESGARGPGPLSR